MGRRRGNKEKKSLILKKESLTINSGAGLETREERGEGEEDEEERLHGGGRG